MYSQIFPNYLLYKTTTHELHHPNYPKSQLIHPHLNHIIKYINNNFYFL